MIDRNKLYKKPWWIIVGGRKRLGRALAELLIDDYNLILTSSKSWNDNCNWTAKISKKNSFRCLQWDANDVKIDLTILSDLQKLAVEDIIPSCVVLASGTFQQDLFGEWQSASLAKTWQINITFPMLITQILYQYMAENSCIQILLDTSIYKPFLKRLPHSIVESGLKTLISGLACLCAPKVRVVGHAIGVVLQNSTTDSKQIIQRNLLHCIGTPKNLELSLRFVASNSYITGSIITVDGGMHLIQ